MCVDANGSDTERTPGSCATGAVRVIMLLTHL
jgi:hypothetical protein